MKNNPDFSTKQSNSNLIQKMQLTWLTLLSLTLELSPASQHLFYITAVAHFRPVARNSSIFACQFVRNAVLPRNLTQEICLLLNVNILYTRYEIFFSSYQYYNMSLTVFNKCYHNVQYQITATFVQAVPIQPSSEISGFHSSVHNTLY